MKKHAVKFIVLMMTSLLIGHVQAEVTIGKVDMQKVIITIKEGVKVREKLKKELEEKQKNFQKDEQEIKKLQETFQKQSVVMAEKARMEKATEIQQKIAKAQEKAKKFEDEMRSSEAKYRDPIIEKLRGIIEQVSTKNGVDITFEQNAAPILYAKKVVDLTSQVVEEYDKKFPVKK